MTAHPQAWSGCCLIIWWYFGCSIEHPGHCLSPNPKLSLLVSRTHIIKEVPWTWHHQPIESTFMILQIFPPYTLFLSSVYHPVEPILIVKMLLC